MNNKTQEKQDVTGICSDLASKQGSGPLAPRAELLESLSAMMDDEAESLEIRRLVRSAVSSPESAAVNSELLSHWRRYHAVRASLQHDLHATPSIDLLTGIRARLAEEAGANNNAGGLFRKSLRTGKMARMAGQGLIAATVAAAVLVAYPLLNRSPNQLTPGALTTTLVAAQMPVQGSMPAMNGDYSASALTRTVSLDDAARRRLETVVLNFSGKSAVLNSNSSAMFVNQFQPFATSTQVPPAPTAAEQPAQRR